MFHLGSLLLNCCISPSLQFFFSIFLFFLLCDLLFFCSSTVFSSCDIFFLHSNVCFCAGSLYPCSSTFSYDFGVFAVPFAFILSLAFFLSSFSRSLFFLLLSLSRSLFFFFSWLFTNFFFICLFWIQFFVADCFSYGGFKIFLWFLMHCIPSVLSCLLNFDFTFSFLVNSFFSLFAPAGFSQTLVFSAFLLYVQPSFVLSFRFSHFRIYLLSDSFYISATIDLFLSLFIPHSSCFDFLLLCENVYDS